MKTIGFGVAVILAGLWLGACGEGEGGGSIDRTPPKNCASGSAWTSGEEGPTMQPGGDCIACHAQGEGPKYDIAGTVMGASNDDLNCNGPSGVQVEITDANNQVITLTTNSAGNFFHEARNSTIAFPIKARVLKDGKVNEMSAAQGTGACNSCHGNPPTGGAPGRILAP